MITITEQNSFRTGPVAVTAEASTLGLKPGEWPETIAASIGNGQPFTLRRFNRSNEGATESAVYFQELGCLTLKILND